MVSDEYELQSALQAERVDPARHGNGLADVTMQVSDKHADHRVAPPRNLVVIPWEVKTGAVITAND
jgi:hypothetical protein